MQRCLSALKLREPDEEVVVKSASQQCMDKAALKFRSIDPRTRTTAITHAQQAIDLADTEALADPPFAILYQLKARLLQIALYVKVEPINREMAFAVAYEARAIADNFWNSFMDCHFEIDFWEEFGTLRSKVMHAMAYEAEAIGLDNELRDVLWEAVEEEQKLADYRETHTQNKHNKPKQSPTLNRITDGTVGYGSMIDDMTMEEDKSKGRPENTFARALNRQAKYVEKERAGLLAPPPDENAALMRKSVCMRAMLKNEEEKNGGKAADKKLYSQEEKNAVYARWKKDINSKRKAEKKQATASVLNLSAELKEAEKNLQASKDKKDAEKKADAQLAALQKKTGGILGADMECSEVAKEPRRFKEALKNSTRKFVAQNMQMKSNHDLFEAKVYYSDEGMNSQKQQDVKQIEAK